MATLRCTAKYRKALALPEKLLEPSTAVHPLGEWYANTLTIQRQPLFHFMNGRVLLSVLIPMRDRRSAESRMVEALGDLLRSFGLPPAAVETFLSHARTFEHARAHDRSILASMRDQASVAKSDGGRGYSLGEIMSRLSVMPCGALGYSSPENEVVRLLQSGGAV